MINRLIGVTFGGEEQQSDDGGDGGGIVIGGTVIVPGQPSTHDLSRTCTPQSYPGRLFVPATLVPWAAPWPEYKPQVAAAVEGRPNASAFENAAAHNASTTDREPVRDLNPVGRTGLRGAGKFESFGPHGMATLLVVREPSTGVQGLGPAADNCEPDVLVVDDDDSDGLQLIHVRVSELAVGSGTASTMDDDVINDALAIRLLSLLDSSHDTQGVMELRSIVAQGTCEDVPYHGYLDHPWNTDEAWFECRRILCVYVSSEIDDFIPRTAASTSTGTPVHAHDRHQGNHNHVNHQPADNNSRAPSSSSAQSASLQKKLKWCGVSEACSTLLPLQTAEWVSLAITRRRSRRPWPSVPPHRIYTGAEGMVGGTNQHLEEIGAARAHRTKAATCERWASALHQTFSMSETTLIRAFTGGGKSLSPLPLLVKRSIKSSSSERPQTWLSTVRACAAMVPTATAAATSTTPRVIRAGRLRSSQEAPTLPLAVEASLQCLHLLGNSGHWAEILDIMMACSLSSSSKRHTHSSIDYVAIAAKGNLSEGLAVMSDSDAPSVAATAAVWRKVASLPRKAALKYVATRGMSVPQVVRLLVFSVHVAGAAAAAVAEATKNGNVATQSAERQRQNLRAAHDLDRRGQFESKAPSQDSGNVVAGVVTRGQTLFLATANCQDSLVQRCNLLAKAFAGLGRDQVTSVSGLAAIESSIDAVMAPFIAAAASTTVVHVLFLCRTALTRLGCGISKTALAAEFAAQTLLGPYDGHVPALVALLSQPFLTTLRKWSRIMQSVHRCIGLEVDLWHAQRNRADAVWALSGGSGGRRGGPTESNQLRQSVEGQVDISRSNSSFRESQLNDMMRQSVKGATEHGLDVRQYQNMALQDSELTSPGLRSSGVAGKETVSGSGEGAHFDALWKQKSLFDGLPDVAEMGEGISMSTSHWENSYGGGIGSERPIEEETGDIGVRSRSRNESGGRTGGSGSGTASLSVVSGEGQFEAIGIEDTEWFIQEGLEDGRGSVRGGGFSRAAILEGGDTTVLGVSMVTVKLFGRSDRLRRWADASAQSVSASASFFSANTPLLDSSSLVACAGMEWRPHRARRMIRAQDLIAAVAPPDTLTEDLVGLPHASLPVVASVLSDRWRLGQPLTWASETFAVALSADGNIDPDCVSERSDSRDGGSRDPGKGKKGVSDASCFPSHANPSFLPVDSSAVSNAERTDRPNRYRAPRRDTHASTGSFARDVVEAIRLTHENQAVLLCGHVQGCTAGPACVRALMAAGQQGGDGTGNEFDSTAKRMQALYSAALDIADAFWGSRAISRGSKAGGGTGSKGQTNQHRHGRNDKGKEVPATTVVRLPLIDVGSSPFIHTLAYSKDGLLRGARLRALPVDRKRLLEQRPDQRNYNIFYQLLVGGDHEDLREWGIIGGDNRAGEAWKTGSRAGGAKASKFSIFTSGHELGATPTDRHRFKHTRQMMNVVGIDPEDQRLVWQHLCGIIHLGDIVATHKNPNSAGGEGGRRVEGPDTDYNDNHSGIRANRNSEALEKAASCLNISVKNLHDLIFTQSTHGNLITRRLPVAAATARRDALIVRIYELVADFCVYSANRALAAEGRSFDVSKLVRCTIVDPQAAVPTERRMSTTSSSPGDVPTDARHGVGTGGATEAEERNVGSEDGGNDGGDADDPCRGGGLGHLLEDYFATKMREVFRDRVTRQLCEVIGGEGVRVDGSVMVEPSVGVHSTDDLTFARVLRSIEGPHGFLEAIEHVTAHVANDQTAAASGSRDTSDLLMSSSLGSSSSQLGVADLCGSALVSRVLEWRADDPILHAHLGTSNTATKRDGRMGREATRASPVAGGNVDTSHGVAVHWERPFAGGTWIRYNAADLVRMNHTGCQGSAAIEKMVQHQRAGDGTDTGFLKRLTRVPISPGVRLSKEDQHWRGGGGMGLLGQRSTLVHPRDRLTTITRFREALWDSLAALDAVPAPRYVLFVRPAPTREPSRVLRFSYVCAQIAKLGLVQAVRLRATYYSHCPTIERFLSDFGMLGGSLDIEKQMDALHDASAEWNTNDDDARTRGGGKGTKASDQVDYDCSSSDNSGSNSEDDSEGSATSDRDVWQDDGNRLGMAERSRMQLSMDKDRVGGRGRRADEDGYDPARVVRTAHANPFKIHQARQAAQALSILQSLEECGILRSVDWRLGPRRVLLSDRAKWLLTREVRAADGAAILSDDDDDRTGTDQGTGSHRQEQQQNVSFIDTRQTKPDSTTYGEHQLDGSDPATTIATSTHSNATLTTTVKAAMSLDMSKLKGIATDQTPRGAQAIDYFSEAASIVRSIQTSNSSHSQAQAKSSQSNLTLEPRDKAATSETATRPEGIAANSKDDAYMQDCPPGALTRGTDAADNSHGMKNAAVPDTPEFDQREEEMFEFWEGRLREKLWNHTEMEMHAATSMIQGWWKGHVNAQSWHGFKARVVAAQAWVRMMLTLKRLSRLRRKIVLIQSWARAYAIPQARPPPPDTDSIRKVSRMLMRITGFGNARVKASFRRRVKPPAAGDVPEDAQHHANILPPARWHKKVGQERGQSTGTLNSATAVHTPQGNQVRRTSSISSETGASPLSPASSRLEAPLTIESARNLVRTTRASAPAAPLYRLTLQPILKKHTRTAAGQALISSQDDLKRVIEGELDPSQHPLPVTPQMPKVIEDLTLSVVAEDNSDEERRYPRGAGNQSSADSTTVTIVNQTADATGATAGPFSAGDNVTDIAATDIVSQVVVSSSNSMKKCEEHGEDSDEESLDFQANARDPPIRREFGGEGSDKGEDPYAQLPFSPALMPTFPHGVNVSLKHDAAEEPTTGYPDMDFVEGVTQGVSTPFKAGDDVNDGHSFDQRLLTAKLDSNEANSASGDEFNETPRGWAIVETSDVNGVESNGYMVDYDAASSSSNVSDKENDDHDDGESEGEFFSTDESEPDNSTEMYTRI